MQGFGSARRSRWSLSGRVVQRATSTAGVTICAGVRRGAAARLLWIVMALMLFVWVLTFVILKLPGSYMHVFLVAAIGVGLMNLIAHYWTLDEPEEHEHLRQ